MIILSTGDKDSPQVTKENFVFLNSLIGEGVVVNKYRMEAFKPTVDDLLEYKAGDYAFEIMLNHINNGVCNFKRSSNPNRIILADGSGVEVEMPTPSRDVLNLMVFPHSEKEFPLGTLGLVGYGVYFQNMFRLLYRTNSLFLANVMMYMTADTYHEDSALGVAMAERFFKGVLGLWLYKSIKGDYITDKEERERVLSRFKSLSNTIYLYSSKPTREDDMGSDFAFLEAVDVSLSDILVDIKVDSIKHKVFIDELLDSLIQFYLDYGIDFRCLPLALLADYVNLHHEERYPNSKQFTQISVQRVLGDLFKKYSLKDSILQDSDYAYILGLCNFHKESMDIDTLYTEFTKGSIIECSLEEFLVRYSFLHDLKEKHNLLGRPLFVSEGSFLFDKSSLMNEDDVEPMVSVVLKVRQARSKVLYSYFNSKVYEDARGLTRKYGLNSEQVSVLEGLLCLVTVYDTDIVHTAF